MRLRQVAGLLLTLLIIFCTLGVDTVNGEPGGETITAEEQKNQIQDTLKLNAQSAVLMDASTGRILYGKNETIQRPMASTTKIMTCILALEVGNLSDTVTATKKAASQPKVHLGVREGETFHLEDLLYSLMLESHNDAAMMIAEHIGGSQEGFAKLMNQKARDLGCTQTYFITPNGLDAKEEINGEIKEHSTTAADLSRIMNYCINQSPVKEEFLKITGTRNYFFSDLEGKRSFSCTNHNALLSMMEGAFSGKTGFTSGAGYSYVGALENDGRVFTIALLGCGWPPHKTYKWTDARKLFNYGLERYHIRDVYKEQQLPDIMVEKGISSTGNLGEPVTVACTIGAGEEKSLNYLLAEDETVEITTKLSPYLTAPVSKGQSVGTITYTLNDQIIKTYPVYTAAGVKRLSAGWCVQKVIDLYLTMPGL